MGKALTIYWSPQAELNYNNILDKIEAKWSLTEVNNFDEKAMRLINMLKTQNKMCPTSKQVNIRKCVITSQSSVIYKITKVNIELVDFIDNRTDHKY